MYQKMRGKKKMKIENSAIVNYNKLISSVRIRLLCIIRRNQSLHEKRRKRKGKYHISFLYFQSKECGHFFFF